MVKIGTRSWNFRRDLKSGAMTIEGLLRTAASMGLDGVEVLARQLPSFALERVREYQKEAADIGVEIAAIALETDFAHPDPGVRRAEIETACTWTRIAGLSGIPIVKTFTGDLDPRADEAAQRGWVRDALAECAESAQAYGVTVVPENHSSVCFTYQELLSLVKDVGHPRCRACPDVYNFSKHTGEDVVYEAARALVKDSPYSHLQFYEIDDTGRELHMDMKRLVKIYQDAGYRGYLMIEWEGKEDPYWAVSNAATYLRSILS